LYLYDGGSATIGLQTNGASYFNGGNVGIGTNSPSSLLHLSNSVGPVITMDDTAGRSTVFRNVSPSTAAAIGTVSNHTFQILTNNTNRILITEGGNVLIGTATDNSNKLRVNGSIWADGSIRSSNGTITTLLGFDAVTGPAGILNTTSGHQLWIQTGGITRIAVEAGGNVTIGSVAASERLVVYESAIDSKCYVHIQNNRSRNAGVLTRTTNGSFIAGTSINTDTFMYQIYDNVAGQNRLVVTSGGNVLINNATDVTGATLNVNGNIRTAAATNLTAANWKLGTARGGTVTTNATVRVEIDGALVDLVARYV
jgi:hypothetical protein